MKIIDEIKSETLIVCPLSYKERILLEISNDSILYNIKFMSLQEYQSNYLFTYDQMTIAYLNQKYNMKVANAITLLKNLIYVEDKVYKSDKLNYLVRIKKELLDNGLLIVNDNFKSYLNNVKIIVYGYELDKFNLSLFKSAVIIEENNSPKNIPVYHFENILEEVEFVFNEISELLSKGIDINNIYLMNVDNEYIPYLKMFSRLYQIPVIIPSDDKIIGTEIGKYFLKLVNDNESRENIFNSLQVYKDNEIYSILIGILNKYVNFFELGKVKELIKYDLENTCIPHKNYQNVVRIKEVLDLVNSNEFIYLLNFNNPSIPKMQNDTNYIDDKLKVEVNMSTTDELNLITKKQVINSIYGINNIEISYKDKTPFNSYYPSILLDDLSIELRDYPNNYNYSDNYNKFKYAYLLDEFIKYGEHNNDLDKLYSTYNDINYRTYDNQYTPIDKESMMAYLDNKLTLSYSHIDNYYKCAFMYYLSNILKIDIYEETFNTNIGNLFHEVLSHYNDSNFDIDKFYQDFIDSKEFSHKEIFFLNKLKSDLLFIIDTIKSNLKLTGLTKELYEQKINIVLKDNPYIIFKGFVDKIMYNDKNNETLVSIIDYKTGSINTNINDIKDGLSLQLPVYLYLVKNSGFFKNIKFTGFYLQHILNNEIKIVKNKTYLEMKKENLKLNGYSTNDLDRLSIFDSSYENSEMIKGVKVKKDGELSSTSKGLSDEEIDDIINIVASKIDEAMQGILDTRFVINPKVKKNNNVSCTFCSFKDICYKKEKDVVYLESGEEDAKMD